MKIGVRFDVSDPTMIRQFHRAFRFWESVLDASFYDEPSAECTVAIEPATKEILLEGVTVARAQMPDRLNFAGWIAVDPNATAKLSEDEAVATWIHEIGHILGLKHNADPHSLMYFLDVDGTSELDEADLQGLAALHAMRRVVAQLPRQQAYIHLPTALLRQHVGTTN